MSRRPLQRNGWLRVVVAPLFALHIRLVYHLSRLTTRNEETLRLLLEQEQPFIGCFWHGRLMEMAVFRVAQRAGRLSRFWPRRHPAYALINTRAEGLMFSRAYRWLGLRTLAGGAGAGRTIRQALSRGASVLFAADGPLGPHRRAKPGLIRLARLTGAPIVPVGLSASLRTMRSGWDRLVVPWPFGRVACVFGEPIRVPRDAGNDSIETILRQLENHLDEATDEADRVCGQKTAASTATEFDPVHRR